MTLTKKIMAVAFVAMTCALTSCLDDDDDEEEFNVNLEGFILQEASGDSLLFKPYFYVKSTSQTYPLYSASLMSTATTIDFEKYSDYTFISDTTAFTSISDLSNIYILRAISTTGASCGTYVTLSIAESDTIGPIIVDDLQYNGTRITCSVRESTNLTSLGIEIIPYNDGAAPSRVDGYFVQLSSSPVFTDSICALSYEISLATQLATDHALVRVFALNNTLMRESETAAIYNSGSSEFE